MYEYIQEISMGHVKIEKRKKIMNNVDMINKNKIKMLKNNVSGLFFD